jgi:hypothetical protein
VYTGRAFEVKKELLPRMFEPRVVAAGKR